MTVEKRSISPLNYGPLEARAVHIPRCLPVAEGPDSVPVLDRDLTAAELTLGRSVTACLDTAAELHGFSTHRDPDTHVLGDARSTLGALKVASHASDPAARDSVDSLLSIPPKLAVRLAAGR